MAGKVQHYLRTEYIQPPPGPPTLDAKNSPLALLAQTCSAIGRESSANRKTSLPAKLYSNKEVRKSSPVPTSIVVSSSSSPVLVESKRSSPPRSLKRETSSLDDCASPSKKLRSSPDASRARDTAKSHAPSLLPTEQRKLSAPDGKRRSAVSLDEAETKMKSDSSRHKSLSDASPNTSRALGAPCGCPTASSAPSDTARSASLTTSPQQQQMMSLYDSYCLGCQGPHLSGNPCLEMLKLPHFSLYPFGNPSTTFPFYAQAQMLMAARNAGATAAVDPSPQHVCNWVTAEAGSCGKRFATADELFNHLRTHAIAPSNTAANANFLLGGLDKMSVNPYAAYLSQQAAALAATSTSNPINTNFLSRSHSPLSRFQSYKSNMFSQLSGMPSLPLTAGMGPYCSPYSLYGQRIGASAASAFSYP